MRTLEAMAEKKRLEKALETMEVYAPIAGRLGIRTLKEELEDTALKFLDPVAFNEIEEALLIRKSAREKFIRQIKERITARINESVESTPNIEGRVKSIYGIYRKVYMAGRSFEEIYDIYAMRIIVDTVTECYNILGLMHDMFKPIPGRFKDYISTPKPNMYQSLHTTVLSREAVPFEIQIRTRDMHQTAEYGIAAHWKYKEGIRGSDILEERLSWARRMIEAQQESGDAEDILRSIKSDLAPEDVFVLTPKGMVISLPLGSTVIDFAYAIHTEVGHKTVGAKVDGRIVPLSYQVCTGEIVEVLTTGSGGRGPSRDWLMLVKTSEAKTKIRSWFRRERREENILEGRDALEKELRRSGISFTEAESDELFSDLARRYHYAALDDMFAALGYGGLQLAKIMPRIKEEYQRLSGTRPMIPEAVPAQKGRKPEAGVIIEGIDGCLIKFAKCCCPMPGDEIAGFVTRGFGVSVHKKDCSNITKMAFDSENKERLMNASWAHGVKATFDSSLLIKAADRHGLLADITASLSSIHVSIRAITAKEPKNGFAELNLTVESKSTDHLSSIISRLTKINGILSVVRC